MKSIKFIILSLFLLISVDGFSKKIPGQILYSSDTINVIFQLPTNLLTKEPFYESFQNKVTYFDSNDNKQILLPSEANEIRFIYGPDTVRMISVDYSRELGNRKTSRSKIFLRIIVDGSTRIFILYGNSNHEFHDPDRYVLIKKNLKTLLVKSVGFRRSMVEFFDDCLSLIGKIKGKEYKHMSLFTIVEFYNTSCH